MSSQIDKETYMLAADLTDFVAAHRDHGQLEGDAGELTNGYRLRVACRWGVTFHRWITP